MVRTITEQSRAFLIGLIESAAIGTVLRLNKPTRSLEQNALLWPLLDDIARQVNWYGQKLKAEEWKDVFTAALKKAKVIPGLDGGFVVCGQSTSAMDKATFSELLDLIQAFGADHGVEWSNDDGRGIIRPLAVPANDENVGEGNPIDGRRNQTTNLARTAKAGA